MSPSASPNPTDPLLAVEALTVTLRSPQGPRPVLRDVSFSLARGESVAVLGEHGSGLSELLLTLLGLLPAEARPTVAGNVRLARATVGTMWLDDGTALDPVRRIGRQLAQRVRNRRDIPAILAAADLDAAGLDMWSYPHRLSAEQRQRVLLALALARSPALLVLQDPGAGLDHGGRADLLRRIAAVRDRDGMAVLTLTADPATAAALAPRLLVMHAGRIVETGATADVLSRPAHPVTEAMLAARCRIDIDRRQRLLPIVVGQPMAALGAADSGCGFRGPCPAGSKSCAQAPPLGPAQWHGGQVACWNVASPARRPPPPPRWQPLPASALAPVLRLDAVSHRYAPLRPGARAMALSDIELRLADREAVAVVGPAGAGKTTLLRIAAGLLRPSGGRRGYPGEDRPQMIVADARAALPPWRSVGAIVGERLRLGLSSSERMTRIEEALALAQLPPDLSAVRPADLTPEQAQRVALARALIVPPEVLICDEPLALLDSRAAAGVLNLLAGLRRTQRLALLYATDDLAAARYLADRIVVLADGRIVEQGTSDSVVAAPRSEAAQALLAFASAPLVAASA